LDKILIIPTGGWLVAKMLESCGSTACDASVAELLSMKSPIALNRFYFEEEGAWIKPVFGNLKAYATDEEIVELDVVAVAKYFGGKHHIRHMIPKARASGISYELGEAAGLVLDVLLPLDGEVYKNDGFELVIKGGVRVGDLKGTVSCYHRGLVVTLPLPEADVSQILAEQRQSPEFMAALKRIKGPVSLRPEHQTALKEQA
jgi:hypothetical protein